MSDNIGEKAMSKHIVTTCFKIIDNPAVWSGMVSTNELVAIDYIKGILQVRIFENCKEIPRYAHTRKIKENDNSLMSSDVMRLLVAKELEFECEIYDDTSLPDVSYKSLADRLKGY